VKPGTYQRLGLLLAAGTVLALTFALGDPLSWRIFPRCPWHWLTGLDCPGCGTSRAFTELVHGHVLAALHLNALTVIAVPLCAGLWVSGRLDQLKPGWIRALLAVIIVFGVVRNLSF